MLGSSVAVVNRILNRYTYLSENSEDWPSGLFSGDVYLSPQIFGNVTDATLSHGILIVMYSSGLVRLYSFQAITKQVEKIQICHIQINLRFEWRYDFFFNEMFLT